MKLLYLSLLFIFFSCKKKVDYSNPQSVLEHFYYLKAKGDINDEYMLIADTCKSYATLTDYNKRYSNRDSIITNYNIQVNEVEQKEIDPDYPLYRTFYVKYSLINKKANDTLKYETNYTLYNKNNKWSILWTYPIEKAAYDYYTSNKLEDAYKTLNQVISIDPFNCNSYQELGWVNYRLGNFEQALEAAKKVQKYCPEYVSIYNLIGSIYSSTDNEELAIKTYKKGFELTNDKGEMLSFLSNASNSFIKMKKYNNAKKHLNEALKLDSTYTHSWFLLGSLYNSLDKRDSAIFAYQKAIKNPKMNDYLQQQLYYHLSYTQFLAGINANARTRRKKYLKEAKSNILLAMEYDHENSHYTELLDKIKRAEIY
jgi:tetratricopeptide (TPR) repeat protein